MRNWDAFWHGEEASKLLMNQKDYRSMRAALDPGFRKSKAFRQQCGIIARDKRRSKVGAM